MPDRRCFSVHIAVSCGPQLHSAVELIEREGKRGNPLLAAGRKSGLDRSTNYMPTDFRKMALDTVEANHSLDLKMIFTRLWNGGSDALYARSTSNENNDKQSP